MEGEVDSYSEDLRGGVFDLHVTELSKIHSCSLDKGYFSLK